MSSLNMSDIRRQFGEFDIGSLNESYDASPDANMIRNYDSQDGSLDFPTSKRHSFEPDELKLIPTRGKVRF
jgi:hypothetical protein